MEVTSILDGGSDVNVIHQRLVRPEDILPCGTDLAPFAGDRESDVRGKTMKLCEMTDDWGVTKRFRVPFFVVADLNSSILLGKPWHKSLDALPDFKNETWHYRISAENLEVATSKRQARKWDKEAKVRMVLARNKLIESKDPKTEHARCPLCPHEEHEQAPGDSNEEETRELPPEYREYAKVFDEEAAAELAPLDGPTHAIDLEPGTTPSWGTIYSLADSELKVLEEYLRKAEQKGWIRRSSSPAGAPVLFVPKKGGKLRLCVDYRALNQITRKNRAPLPLIHEILDRLKGAKVYTKLDLKDAYHRIRIREGDEWKTAFRCRYGHFEYQVMPFGLTNAPATFQSHINQVLRGLVDYTCIVYLDDILIYSSDPAEHQEHVRQVLDKLMEHGLYANLQKCEFHTDTVSYLGFVISPKGIHMERSRIEAVEAWPIPRNVTEILSFLGFTNFYRRFIKGYSKIVAPLTNMTRGKNKGNFLLGRDEKAAFEQLKQKFLEAPVLAHFDPEAKLRIETDASNFAIGAILSQLQGDSWHPVAYLSRKLNGPEQNYATPDAEMLAIVEAFRTWRHYVAYVDHPVQILTDHLNHSYLAGKKKLSNKQVSQLRELSPFNFVIEYRPGKANPADGLSRRVDLRYQEAKEELSRSYLPDFLGRFKDEQRMEAETVGLDGTPDDYTPQGLRFDLESRSRLDSVRQVGRVSTAKQVARPRHASSRISTAIKQVVRRSAAVTSPEVQQTLLEALLQAQKEDALTAKLLQREVEEKTTTDGQRLRDWFVGDDQLLRYKGRTFVPLGMRTEVLMLFHDDPTAGHQGVGRTLVRIADVYFWRGMKRDVKNYVNTCIVCQTTKARQHLPYGELAALPTPSEPWKEISMDFITGLPEVEYERRKYNAILVIVDRFTKYALYIPCSKNISSEGLANKFLRHVFRPYGMPRGIVSDRGSVFTSAFWRSFCHLLGCKRRLSTAFHPQTDGQTERQNQNLEHYLRAFCNKDQMDWIHKLPLAEFTYNTAQHSATRETPALLLHGFQPEAPSASQIQLPHMNNDAIARVREMQDTREAAARTLREASESYQKWYNKGRTKKKFKVGDWVLISTKHLNLRRPTRKLAEKFAGPYQIERIVGDSGLAYQLRLPSSVKIHNVFNVTNLEEFKSRDSAPTEPLDHPFMPDVTYEVEKIVSHRYNGRRRLYYVKWKGYSDEENTWIKKSDFVDGTMLQEYEAASQNRRIDHTTTTHERPGA